MLIPDLVLPSWLVSSMYHIVNYYIYLCHCLQVVELLVSMLQVPVRGSQDQAYVTLFKLLYILVKGEQRHHSGHMGQHSQNLNHNRNIISQYMW